MRGRGENEGGLLSIKFWYPVRQLHFIIINRLDGNWGFVISQHNREVSKSKDGLAGFSWPFNIKGKVLIFPKVSVRFYLKVRNARKRQQNAGGQYKFSLQKKKNPKFSSCDGRILQLVSLIPRTNACKKLISVILGFLSPCERPGSFICRPWRTEVPGLCLACAPASSSPCV